MRFLDVYGNPTVDARLKTKVSFLLFEESIIYSLFV